MGGTFARLDHFCASGRVFRPRVHCIRTPRQPAGAAGGRPGGPTAGSAQTPPFKRPLRRLYALRVPSDCCLVRRTCEPKGRLIMLRYQRKSDRLLRQLYDLCAKPPLWPAAVLLSAGLTFGTGLQVARAAAAQTEPFKVASIHIETNASACDMGAQIR